ncbi:MAG: tRNA (adenosine(37)-N6)-dimethylallyltransferase MiaA [Sphingomonadaceae bacterium]
MSNPVNSFPPIIVITGPTAVGKSAVALELAARFGAEIVSADSRQIYRHLDIGTAKPTVAEREAVPHHLLDLVEPDEPYSVASFRSDADRVLTDIARRGRVAFLVGGSPHYVQAVVERLEIPPVPPQPELRGRLEEYARIHGADALHARLREVDPAAADQIAPTNVRRVIRALEVCQVTGEPFSQVGRRRGAPLPALRLGITDDRARLYERIDRRLDLQIEAGLIEEARSVLEMGFSPNLPPLKGLVYREAVAVVQGRMGLADALRRMKETTHAFVRRQYTWFRRDPEIQWMEAGPGLPRRVADAVARHLDATSRERAST